MGFVTRQKKCGPWIKLLALSVLQVTLAGCGLFSLDIGTTPQGGGCPAGSPTCAQGTSGGTGSGGQSARQFQVLPSPSTAAFGACRTGFVVAVFENNVETNSADVALRVTVTVPTGPNINAEAFLGDNCAGPAMTTIPAGTSRVPFSFRATGAGQARYQFVDGNGGVADTIQWVNFIDPNGPTPTPTATATATPTNTSPGGGNPTATPTATPTNTTGGGTASYEIRISPVPGTLPNDQCHAGFVVRTYVNGLQANPTGVQLNLVVPPGTPSVRFVTGSSCTPGGTSLNLAAGVSEGFVSIYAPPGVEGIRVLRIQDQANVFPELVLTVLFTRNSSQPPDTATDIRLSGPGEAEAGRCTAITVTALNNGVPVQLATTLTVNLSFSPGDPVPWPAVQATSFYLNADCTDDQKTSIAQITGGTSSRTVWFNSVRALRYELRGVNGLLSSTLVHNIRPSSNDPKLVKILSTFPGSTTAGRCIPGVAALTDPYGNPIPAGAQTSVQLIIGDLSPTTYPAIYTDPSCNAAAANRSLQFAMGQATSQFFFRVDLAKADPGYHIEPTAAGYRTVPSDIIVLPANAAQLVIESDNPNVDSSLAGNCVNLHVLLQDMYGNNTRNTATTNMIVEIAFLNDPSSPDPSDLSRAWLSPGFNCPGEPRPTGGRSSIQIPILPGGDNALFSMILLDAGTVTLRAQKLSPATPSVADGYYAVPPPFVVLPNLPMFARVLPPNPALPLPRAGECIELSYELRDAYENLTYARDNTPLQVIFEEFDDGKVPQVTLNANCTGFLTAPDPARPEILNITALKNTQGGKIYVRHTVAEDFLVRLAGPAAVPPIAKQDPAVRITFRANVPRQLTFRRDSATRALALQCSLGIHLVLRDQYGNPTAPSAPMQLTLSRSQTAGQSGATVDFMANSDCSGPTNTFTLAGQDTVSFYARGSRAATFDISVTTSAAGWPFSGFPYPVLSFEVKPNAGLDNLPVAVDFFRPTEALSGLQFAAGAPLGPLVLRTLNRASAVVPSDMTAQIAVKARTTAEGQNVADLKVYQATTTSCLAAEIPSGQVAITAGQSDSQPFCITATVAGARELYADTGLFVGMRRGFVVRPNVVTKFRFVPKAAPTVGLCSLITLETRDAYNNLSPILTEIEDPSYSGAAIVEILSLTTDTDLFNDRRCYDRLSTGELTYPTGTSRVGFYLLSNAVMNNLPVPVRMSARTVDPNRNVLTEVTLPIDPGTPSHRTMYLTGVRTSPPYVLNGCYAGSVRLVQQNNPTTINPDSGAIVRFPAAGSIEIAWGAAGGTVYSGPSCTGASGQAITKSFAKNDLALADFTFRPSVQGYAGIQSSAAYGGLLLRRRVNFYVDANQCTNGTTRTDRLVFDLGGGYWVSVYVVYLCQNGAWVLYTVYTGRLRDGCFPPEAEIAIAGGLPKRADLVAVGDELWNPVTRQPAKVLKIVKGPEREGLYEITAGKKRSRVSGDHPMVTRTGFKAARDVKRGDELQLADGSFARVKTARQLAAKRGQVVYNFVLDVPETASADSKLIEADGFVTGEWTLQRALKESREQRKGEMP